MTDRDEARRQFRERVRQSFDEADESFRGEYADAIKQLRSLSDEDVKSLMPDGVDAEVYDRLIATVKQASQANLAQAELKNRIADLGDVAVQIAKRVPALAAIF